jgi:signal transduction histidine kinase
VRWEFAAAFASRLAHDLSNVFTGVNGFSELALLHLGEDQPARPFVKDVHRSGQRGIELAQRLHLLRTCVTPENGRTAVAAAVVEVASALRARLPARPAIETNVPAHLPSVRVGAEPLQHVLTELVQNAADAAGPSGHIEIVARAVSLGASEASELYGQARPGPHVEVRVTDDGPGVADDLLGRVLTSPMATSRPEHRGLGLAIVFRVLCAHRGGFSLGRSPDCGAVARVYFPVA